MSKRLTMCVFFCASLMLGTASRGLASEEYVSLLLGYKGGMGFRAGAGITSFAQGFPLGLDFAVGYTRRDPGEAIPARRIFINEADNGTPQKSGYFWDFKLDFEYHIRVNGPKALILYAGPRVSMFDGTFQYVGANEEFDVTSTRWGIGFGVKGVFPVSNRIDFVVAGGGEQYFNGSLHGHDTTYNPDNENVNAKERFLYADANAVINAPKFQPVLMLGLAYNF